MRNCGNCQKFKGNGVECGQTFLLGNRHVKYAPMQPELGPCMEGYVEKKEELVPLSVSSEEHDLNRRRCGDCQKFKGANTLCGESFVNSDGARIYYSPYGENGHGCKDEKFVPKKNNKEFSIKIIDEVHSFKIPDTRVLVAKQQGLGISREMQEELNQTTTKKETSNMKAIIRLADSQLNKQIEDFGGLSLDIREALETMQAEEKKEAAKTAAAEVMTLLKAGQNAIESYVGTINDARRMERQAKDRIEAINRAVAYGKETSNFVPLGILTGFVYAHQVDNEALRTVPKDWTPKSAVKAAE